VVLQTDIADFYPSVYTHSITWAVHSKATAKAAWSAGHLGGLLGDQLDKRVRNSQDSQTMGIPIGPDSSLVIAELILSAADAQLASRLPGLRILRWMDEFEVTTHNRSQAENALATIQQVLLEYELRLNPRKTRISDLQVEFEKEWVSELRSLTFRSTDSGQAHDLIRYFDWIARYHATSTEDHVVKYGISRLQYLAVASANHALFQSLILQAIVLEPAAIRECITALHSAQQNQGLVVNCAALAEALDAVVLQNAPLGYHYEVSWALWAALVWSLPLQSASAVGNMDNSLVAILALDADQHGLFLTPLDKTRWAARMSKQELYEEEWLLAYEANVQGWLPSLSGGDHVTDDPAFGFLKASGVRFYFPVTDPSPHGVSAPTYWP
jgi:hypothetical protein